MPKNNVGQFSFSSGEISPLLLGRADTAKYANGLATAENFIVTPQGALKRRPGFKYLGDPKSQDYGRVFAFRYSNTDTYILEFTDEKLRIWRSEELLESSANSYAISNVLGGPPTSLTITTAAHIYNGQTVDIFVEGVLGYFSINGYLGPATALSANNFNIAGLATSGELYSSGGTVYVLSGSPIEITTPYRTRNGATDIDLQQLYFAQSADVLYICHPYFAPRKLTRTQQFTWTLSTVDNIDGPYMPLDTRNITMTLSGVTDTATMTASSGTPFVVGDINEHVEYNEFGVWKLAKITAFTDSSNVTVDVIDNTLVDFDPNVILSPKATSSATTGTARSIDGTRIVGTSTLTAAIGAIRETIASGVDAKYRTSGALREGVDPSATLAVPAAISSTHAGTFSRNDHGKWVRITPRVWRQISWAATSTDISVTSGATATYMIGTPAPETLKVTNRTITATLTASSAVFASTDVGRHVRLNYSGIWIWCKISGYTSTTIVTVALYAEPPTNPVDNSQIMNHGRTNLWRLGSWSDTTGWPHCVTFHEQRLVYAATGREPHSIWASVSGDFDNFSPTEPDSSVLDDNGFGYTLAASEVNKVVWLQSATVLLIGTIGGEWQARASSSILEPITPTNISVTPQTTYGSIDYARPVKIGSSVLFIQRTGTKLIELSYSFELDSWVGRDLTLASDHILKGTAGTASAKELAWCAEPYNLLWVRISDGTLACLTYNKDQDVAGWTRHIYGNSELVQSICSQTAADNSTHRLYAITRRSAVSGLFTVARLSTDDTTYTDSHTGGGSFSYTSLIKTLPPEGGSMFGTGQGKMKRAARCGIRVYQTTSFKHGASSTPTTTESLPSATFTGDHAFTSEQGYTLEGGYYIANTTDAALNILAWLPQVTVNE
jgi:hypothetical protein